MLEAEADLAGDADETDPGVLGHIVLASASALQEMEFFSRWMISFSDLVGHTDGANEVAGN